MKEPAVVHYILTWGHPYMLLRCTTDIPFDLANKVRFLRSVEYVKEKRYSLSIEYADFICTPKEFAAILENFLTDYYKTVPGYVLKFDYVGK